MATHTSRPWRTPDLASAPPPVFLHQAVAAAHPLAAAAGLQMLREGGSAVDAAVAVQAVLGLVEPQSSGLGGGAFMLVASATPQGPQLDAWDGRETAPAAVNDAWFLDAQGQPLPFAKAVVGGRSVGVPGVLRMLQAAHAVHGRLPWPRLFVPAIELAEAGFGISARLAQQLASDPALRRDPQARRFFYDTAGQARPAGTLLRNPDYAAVLRLIAAGGADAFYRGPVAEAMVRAVQQHPVQPGAMTLADLAAYQPVRRTALCLPWRTLRLCGMPPPSSGMLTIGQILGLLDAGAPIDSEALDPHGLPGEPFLHRYTEAARLAFADRDAYIADPGFVTAPGGNWLSMLRPGYLAGRAARIGDQAAAQVEAGEPANDPASSGWAPDSSHEVPATTHLSIVDAHGQALAMTSSIEAQFGARVMVNVGQGRDGGFLLNNELTDFSFEPRHEGRLVANRVEPGKRPRSSMAPTLVFDATSGALLASLGSPGGPLIIHFVTKTLLGLQAFGLDAAHAISLPNLAPLPGPNGSPGPLLLEASAWPSETLAALRQRGHRPVETDLPSGLQVLVRRADGAWTGAADPRREGVVVGD
jgi:gamma-glutamyltranspeptidase/glutathione hydrolase